MDVAEVRKRLRHTIDRARQEAATRRAEFDAAERDYERFLTRVAVPVCRMVVTALKAEGFPFEVATPAGSVRLASSRSGEDFLELALDTSQNRPLVVGRVSRGRGRRLIRADRPLREDVPIKELSEEDVLQFLLTEIVPFVER